MKMIILKILGCDKIQSWLEMLTYLFPCILLENIQTV